MNSSKSVSTTSETSDYTIVRVDAQEEEFVAPLREYLELNGCTVVVNKQINQPVVYHIVTGDLGYVKSIFSSDAKAHVPRLGIVLGSTLADAQNQLRNLCKIVVVDPTYLTQADVVEIFSFFFAGNETVFDKRRNRHDPFSTPKLQPSPPSPLPPTSTPLPVGDKERIGNIISDVFAGETNEADHIHTEKVIKHRRRKIKTSLWVSLAFLFFIIFFPVIWYMGSVAATAASFAYSGKNLQTSNVTRAKQFSAIGIYWLRQAQFSFGLISFPFRLAGYDTPVRGQERLLSFFGDISSVFDDTFIIVKNGKEVATLLLTSRTGEQGGSPAYAIEQLRMSVVSVSSTLGLAHAQLSMLLRDRTFPFGFSPAASVGEQTLTTLTTLRGILAYTDELLTLYPNFSGFSEAKTYLVLLQNSNELRPTGGFIGSVGVAKFEDGILSDFSIQDVYALDGQLKGHVDPPVPMKDLLGTEHWYLRDSNWDPDFKESATRAMWFYEKEGGSPVDGVVAINVPVVIDFLKATGPILLSDYKDQISAENFFGKSFYYTQNNSFAGSTQKSDFLGTLARALVEKITTEKNINPILVFNALSGGLMHKDIQFMFTNTNLQQLIEHFGWGGRVGDAQACTGVEKEYCTVDSIIPVEANLSVNKVNYFVKRETLREISIAPDGTISETVSFTIRNTADVVPQGSERGIGGSYVPYMRFFVPFDVRIGDVALDGMPVAVRNPKEKGKPVLPYREEALTNSGLRGIGIAFEVQAGTRKTVRITFTHAKPLPFGRGGATLDLVYYKHPGVSDEIIRTVIRYPIYWKAIYDNSMSHQDQTFLAKDGQLEYNSTILQDQLIRLRFTK